MFVQLSCSFPLTRPRKAASEPPAPREDPFLLHTQSFPPPQQRGSRAVPWHRVGTWGTVVPQ